MAGNADAWIVEHRAERGYLYVGRADGSVRANVAPHAKGLRFTYDMVYGGKNVPKKRYPREIIIPGEFAITHVVRAIIAYTGCNADTNTYRDTAKRRKKLIVGLRESGLWENRGRLNWPLPRRLFPQLGIGQFRYLHSYARWCSFLYHRLSSRSQTALYASIKEGAMPLLHEVPGFRALGTRALTGLFFRDPDLWRRVVETCGPEAALTLSADRTFDEEVFAALDQAYHRDLPVLERMVRYGTRYFVDVPHHQVRLAFALRDLFDRDDERIMIAPDLAGLPDAPVGFRWFYGPEIRRQRCAKTGGGERRTLMRERDGLHVIFDYRHPGSWRWIAYGDLSARESLQLNALAAKMPPLPYPPARLRAGLLAEHVHNRLKKTYGWSWMIRSAPAQRYTTPFRRAHVERDDAVVPEDNEVPF